MGDKNYYLFLIKEVEEKKVKSFTVKDDDVGEVTLMMWNSGMFVTVVDGSVITVDSSGMFVAVVDGSVITVDGVVACLLQWSMALLLLWMV